MTQHCHAIRNPEGCKRRASPKSPLPYFRQGGREHNVFQSAKPVKACTSYLFDAFRYNHAADASFVLHIYIHACNLFAIYPCRDYQFCSVSVIIGNLYRPIAVFYIGKISLCSELHKFPVVCSLHFYRCPGMLCQPRRKNCRQHHRRHHNRCCFLITHTLFSSLFLLKSSFSAADAYSQYFPNSIISNVFVNLFLHTC